VGGPPAILKQRSCWDWVWRGVGGSLIGWALIEMNLWRMKKDCFYSWCCWQCCCCRNSS
jgi:hypothetical protein